MKGERSKRVLGDTLAYIMRKQFLHLWAYPCEICKGPVVAGSLGICESEIVKETQLRQLAGVCLSCGHKQDKATQPIRHFRPAEWEPT
jgi:hypothetical protein